MPLPDGTSKIDRAWDDLMTTAETAKYLNMSIHTLYPLLQKGEIPGKKIGKRTWRISRQEINAYVLDNTPSLRVSLQVRDILWGYLVQWILDKTTTFWDIRQGHTDPEFIITDQPLTQLWLQKFSWRVITLVGTTDSVACRENMKLSWVSSTFLLKQQLVADPQILRKLLGLLA